MKKVSLANGVEWEEERLRVLRSCHLLDTQPEFVFDRIVHLVKEVCQVPIVLISLTDAERQWFKSKVGCEITEGPRQTAYCNIAIQQPDILIIPDTLRDSNYAENLHQLNDKTIRFYAGAPLITPDGFALGTLCICDYIPRELTPDQQRTLKELARLVVIEIQRRRAMGALVEQAQQRSQALQQNNFYRKFGIGIGLIMILLLMSAGTSLWALNNSRQNEQKVLHTLNVIRTIDDLELSLRGNLLDVRRYALLPNRSLNNYKRSRDYIFEYLFKLKNLIRNRPIQTSFLQRLETSILATAKTLDQTIIDLGNQDSEGVKNIYLSPQLINIIDSPLNILQEMKTHEQYLLIQHQANSIKGQEINSFILAGTLSLNLFLTIFIFLLIVREIHSRRQAEITANHHREYLEVTLSSIGDAVITTDAQAQITLMNPVAEVLTGCASQDGIGQDFDQIVRIIDAAKGDVYPSPIKAALKFESNQIFDQAVMLLQPDGTRIAIDDSCAPIIGFSGQAEGAVMVFRDVSERRHIEKSIQKMLDRAQEINALKTSFISMVSHEFRTPLTTILSSAELLNYPPVRANLERQQKHLQRIYDAIRRLEAMLDDILLIGRAESGKLQFQPASINVIEIITGVVDAIQAGIGQRHYINVDFGDVVEPTFMDPKLLSHIMTNLISNAVKYSPAGSVVEIKLALADVGVDFNVTDHGIGIPPQDIPKLFTTFQRAGNVGNVQGTGLGLNIVKTCVDLHGGSIRVDSQLHQGTHFQVWLPNRLPAVYEPPV
ncbi:PAS domain-containing protein [Synechocystis salina LEGE 06099]|uniref:ATP-binding protein n=1 Tax=Synechocystis salina TaxID=945780 RepID=UPI001880632C|nr:ATP-binding protein [Synechocystis salina]MBE9202907.1 PAS domain-containing protein [Synechocystis salina LEGE 06099]